MQHNQQIVETVPVGHLRRPPSPTLPYWEGDFVDGFRDVLLATTQEADACCLTRCEQAETLAVPPDDLDQVAAPVSERSFHACLVASGRKRTIPCIFPCSQGKLAASDSFAARCVVYQTVSGSRVSAMVSSRPGQPLGQTGRRARASCTGMSSARPTSRRLRELRCPPSGLLLPVLPIPLAPG